MQGKSSPVWGQEEAAPAPAGARAHPPARLSALISGVSPKQQTTGLCRCAWSPCCSQVREVSARLFSEKLLFLLLFRAVRAVPLTAEPPRPPRALFSGNFLVMSLKEEDGRKPLCAGGVCQP